MNLLRKLYLKTEFCFKGQASKEIQEVILSPPMCIFHHEAELEVIVQDAKSEVRDKKLDEILVKVGTLLCCEDKLNGLPIIYIPNNQKFWKNLSKEPQTLKRP